MQNIEWKPIKGYEDLYMVSNTGLIKSLHWGNPTNIPTCEFEVELEDWQKEMSKTIEEFAKYYVFL